MAIIIFIILIIVMLLVAFSIEKKPKENIDSPTTILKKMFEKNNDMRIKNRKNGDINIPSEALEKMKDMDKEEIMDKMNELKEKMQNNGNRTFSSVSYKSSHTVIKDKEGNVIFKDKKEKGE